MASLSTQMDMKQASIYMVGRRDSETGLLPLEKDSNPFPRWPRVLGAVLNLFILLTSVSIIGILAHSLSSYSGSRGIHFSGLTISWPEDIRLYPAYFILAVSAVSLCPSLLSIIVSIRRYRTPSYSKFEKLLMGTSLLLLVLWIIGDILQRVSEQTPKTDILKWACKRRDSPTNVLVSYTSVCNEQVRRL